MTDHLRALDSALERLKTYFPKTIDLSLNRMLRLLDALGRPQDRLPPVIHVAGTNGKGSTAAFIRAIGEAAGLKIHAYTSPHLVRFAERIRVAGQIISQERLLDVMNRVEVANAGQPATFFEITAAGALVAFAETPADLCILEVGLGGRFDATNVIDRPAVSAITPIGLDHTEFLGTTLAQIAFEKAGIIKPGRPCVSAFQDDAVAAVLAARAAEIGAPFLLMGRDLDAYFERGRLVVRMPDLLFDLPSPRLRGRHQATNAGLAIAALLTLGDPSVGVDAISAGLAAADWPGRVQRLKVGPLGDMAEAAGAELWLDGAHNAHAAAALADTLRELGNAETRPLVLVTAMLPTKDAKGFFAAFEDLDPRVLAAECEAAICLEPHLLAAVAGRQGLRAEVAGPVAEAVESALKSPGPAPRIVICGTFYLLGDALALSPETWPR